MEVLAEWERRLVKGFLVNRFRGQASLLQDAFDYVERHTGLPTLGVVPYLHHLNLPQEDSVEFKSGALDGPVPDGEHVEVAVLDLPHISNFTDFDPLRLEPDVRVRVVRRGDALGKPDVVILPGVEERDGRSGVSSGSGLEPGTGPDGRSGDCEVVGVCGGLQILGRSITDPSGIESLGGGVEGLGLLNIETELAVEKTLKQVWGTHVDSGLEVGGMRSIMAGRTSSAKCPLSERRRAK
jgi:cobyric acid synthase